MATFALVHGAWHGPWCWERLGPELEALGHAVIAPELPGDDPEAGCPRYADVVVDALVGAKDPVVVGHSFAGLTIPIVADRRPVRRLVYLCAFVPRPGRPPFEREPGEPLDQPDGFAAFARDELGRSVWTDADAAIERLYTDCPDDVARAAFARLRPQARLPNVEPCPLDALPGVTSAYLLAAADAAVRPEWARWTARNRLGVEPVEMPGGHSPMLSRPAELARTLDRLA